ncbi:hypothetical protein BJ742DRAFT_828511 [Cladochytrium replicatum]|nr:hypothetical protein BJ742DRAFT_828511 [Cladochytrium replicatum]
MDVGEHCAVASCRQLDFLPYTCNFCRGVYCHEHFKVAAHTCASAPQDARAIVCPVCQQVVPVARGEDPNYKVNDHISQGCKNPGTTASAPAYTHLCSYKGCKTREVVKINCSRCGKSYCIRHRLESNHACTGSNSSSPRPTRPSQPASVSQPRPQKQQQQQQQQRPAQSGRQTVNARADAAQLERERLERVAAGRAAASGVVPAGMSEDEQLALALQLSEEEAANRTQGGSSTGKRSGRTGQDQKNCTLM